MKYLLLFALLSFTVLARAGDRAPVVEVEEDVYTFTDANNGADPMWCYGSTSLVRSGDRLFASGVETIPDAKPPNNCRWMLFQRGTSGWSRVGVDTEGRTREPSPIAAFADGRVFLSVNPTLDKEAKYGPARPDVLQFRAADPKAPPVPLVPVWQGKPAFAEHSYRSLVADSVAGELLLFQNVGYTHAEWTFRDRAGKWSAQGQLKWPWGAAYDKPEPVRICYPNVALRDRAVHFVGVSDVLEPNPAWRAFKLKLTGQQWDYDFRRLFYTWTSDITKEPFAEWVEIASREKTCGKIWPGDLWLAPNGDAHLLWSERALDDRLRDKFFPAAKQSEALNYAVVRQGKVIRRSAVMETKEVTPGLAGSPGRFHVTPDNRLFVVYRASIPDKKGSRVFENRIVEILPDGALGAPVRIPFQKPFTSFFTTTVRAGSAPSWTLELLGLREGAPNTISYARVNCHVPFAQEAPKPADRDLDPPGWTTNAPRDEIRPVFSYEPKGGPKKSGSFVVAHDQRDGLDGWFQKSFAASGGAFYRFHAVRKTSGVAVPRRSALVRVLWQDEAGKMVSADVPDRQARELGHVPSAEPDHPTDGETNPQGWTTVGGVYRAPAKAARAVVELHLQWAPKGRVEWSDVEFVKTTVPTPRKVRLSTIHYKPTGKSARENCEEFAPLLAEAAKQKADLVVLGETVPSVGVKKKAHETAEAVPGPTTAYFGELAKKHTLHMVLSLYERDGHLVYNTAVLIGPDGKLIGKYRKVCLPHGEVEQGIAPGKDYPVFDTKVGKVGLMVCYDGFFPEVARELSNRGAEVIAWPVWGCNSLLAQARACENHIYLVSSTFMEPKDGWMISAIFDRTGKPIAKAEKWGTVAIAEVDLSQPYVGPWNLGDFRSMVPRHRPIAVPEATTANQPLDSKSN